jgi:hypothetical protein
MKKARRKRAKFTRKIDQTSARGRSRDAIEHRSTISSGGNEAHLRAAFKAELRKNENYISTSGHFSTLSQHEGAEHEDSAEIQDVPLDNPVVEISAPSMEKSRSLTFSRRSSLLQSIAAAILRKASQVGLDVQPSVMHDAGTTTEDARRRSAQEPYNQNEENISGKAPCASTSHPRSSIVGAITASVHVRKRGSPQKDAPLVSSETWNPLEGETLQQPTTAEDGHRQDEEESSTPNPRHTLISTITDGLHLRNRGSTRISRYLSTDTESVAQEAGQLEPKPLSTEVQHEPTEADCTRHRNSSEVPWLS